MVIINSISVQYSNGLLPDIILLTQGYYHRGTRLNTAFRGLVFTAYETVHYYYNVGCCTTLSLFCFCFCLVSLYGD